MVSVSHETLYDAVKSNNIDFVMNTYICSYAPDQLHWQNTIFTIPGSKMLVVKQFAIKNVKISLNLITLILFILLCMILIVILKRIVSLKSKFWSANNIIHILIRGSTNWSPNTTMKKITFIGIICISFLLSVNFLDYVVHVFYVQEKYVTIRYIKDLLEHKITPSINANSKYLLLKYSRDEMEQILYRKAPNIMRESNCIASLFNGSDNIEGCENEQNLIKLLLKRYVQLTGKHEIRQVEEPLMNGWYTIYLPQNSPYT